MKILFSALTTCTALLYLFGYKTGTREEIRELHDSRLKDIYYYTVRK